MSTEGFAPPPFSSGQGSHGCHSTPQAQRQKKTKKALGPATSLPSPSSALATTPTSKATAMGGMPRTVSSSPPVRPSAVVPGHKRSREAMQAGSAAAEVEILEPPRKKLLRVPSEGEDKEEVPHVAGTAADAEVVTAEAKKMSETSRRRLGVIAKWKKQKRQPEASVERVSDADLEEQPLAERQRQRSADPVIRRAPVSEPAPTPSKGADATSSKASGKRPMTVDLDAASTPKRVRLADSQRAIFAAEDEDGPTDAVTLACPSKTVQFANHMIVGSQMDLAEIDELSKKGLREEAGRAFRLQATASMDMWLCMKRAITAAERAKRLYEDGRSRVTDATKALQDHENLVQDMQAAKRQIQAHEAKLAEMREALDGAEQAVRDAEGAKVAVQAALEASERSKAVEIETAVNEAIRGYRSSAEFTSLVDNEVASEMADLIYRFKRFNPGQKLNLNFAADPPPLPEGITEEMIEEYEGEDAPVDSPDAEEVPEAATDVNAETTGVEGGQTAEA